MRSVSDAAGGEHEHGGSCLFAALLDAAADFQAIHVGQHEVENDKVRSIGLKRGQPRCPVGGVHKTIAGRRRYSPTMLARRVSSSIIKSCC